MATSDTPAPFHLESYYTPTLPDGGDHLTVITEVDAAPSGLAASPQQRVLLFIIDKSGSMSGDPIEAVKAAVLKGVDALDASSVFGVVAFDETASVVVSPRPATPSSKAEAHTALRWLHGSGGTAFSTGLGLARSLFMAYPDAIRRGIFLTDGNNETERPGAFEPVLESCVGVFECDCWGLGTHWTVGEVMEVARRLNGKASLIPGPDEVEAAFRAAVEKAAAKAVANVRLRLWSPQGAQVTLLKQMNPTIEDLTPKGVRISPQVVEFAIGSWAPGESRDYQIDVSVPPGALGEEMLAVRPSIIYVQGGQEQEIRSPEGRVVITWTTDEALSSRINPRVAHYTGQEELAQAIQAGLEARERGDEDTATRLLGTAVRLAASSDNEEMTARLKKVVDVEDAATGTVRLKRSVDKAATMDLELESTTTKRAARRPVTNP
jgi:hypothetical protein